MQMVWSTCPYFTLVCTVSTVAAIMIKTHNTITANSIPDFRNWPQAGRGEDEGNVTGYRFLASS